VFPSGRRTVLVLVPYGDSVDTYPIGPEHRNYINPSKSHLLTLKMPALHFAPLPKVMPPSAVPDGEDLMQRLLDKGIKAFEVDWNGIVSTMLPVEDDAIFLIGAFGELDRFLSGGVDHHDALLFDGLIDFSARREQGSVVVKLVHTPHLDRRFSTEHEIRWSQGEYVAAWNRLISELCAL
jgi:hypothetical protein